MSKPFGLTQEWVAKVTSQDDGFPGANGRPEQWGCDGCDAMFNSHPPTGACPNCGDEAIGPREDSPTKDTR